MVTAKKEKTPTKLEDGRRKKRPGVEEQTEIITQAAIELFVEHGTRSTSIAQICARADVSKPTFYRCFKDKEALVSRLYDSSVNAHVGALLKATFPKDQPIDITIKDALNDLLDAIFKQAQLAQLLIREYGDPHSPAAQIIDSAFERIATVMENTFKSQNMKSPSRTALKAIMSAFQWIVYDAIRAGLSPATIQQAKDASHELAAMLFANIAS